MYDVLRDAVKAAYDSGGLDSVIELFCEYAKIVPIVTLQENPMNAFNICAEEQAKAAESPEAVKAKKHVKNFVEAMYKSGLDQRYIDQLKASMKNPVYAIQNTLDRFSITMKVSLHSKMDVYNTLVAFIKLMRESQLTPEEFAYLVCLLVAVGTKYDYYISYTGKVRVPSLAIVTSALSKSDAELANELFECKEITAGG